MAMTGGLWHCFNRTLSYFQTFRLSADVFLMIPGWSCCTWVMRSWWTRQSSGDCGWKNHRRWGCAHFETTPCFLLDNVRTTSLVNDFQQLCLSWWTLCARPDPSNNPHEIIVPSRPPVSRSLSRLNPNLLIVKNLNSCSQNHNSFWLNPDVWRLSFPYLMMISNPNVATLISLKLLIKLPPI